MISQHLHQNTSSSDSFSQLWSEVNKEEQLQVKLKVLPRHRELDLAER
jgi:hypothetical protein